MEEIERTAARKGISIVKDSTGNEGQCDRKEAAEKGTDDELSDDEVEDAHDALIKAIHEAHEMKTRVSS